MALSKRVKAVNAALGIPLLVLAMAACGARGRSEQSATGTTTATPQVRALRGQVFIVTTGRENIRLGLVRVDAVREAEIHTYLDAKTKDSADQTAILEALLTEAEHTLAQDRTALRAAVEADERDWKQVLKMPTLVYHGAEHKAAIDKATKRRNQSAGTVAQLRRQIDALESPDYLCSSLPTGLASTKTDADGRFTMAVSQSDTVVLTARADRQTPQGSESYCWMVHPTGDETLLANDNLITAPGAEFGIAYTQRRLQRRAVRAN